MEHYQRELLISRICCGYLRYKTANQVLLIKSPTLDVVYESNEIYQEIYNKSKEEGVLTDKDILLMLLENKLWTTQNEKDYTDVLPKHVEYWKEELFKHRLNKPQLEKTRKYLAVAKEELNRLSGIRHFYDYISCHGVAIYAKTQFIVEHSTFLPASNTKYSWDDASLYRAMTFYQSSTIREETMRNLSHTNPWDNIWAAGKKNGPIFPNCGVELTIEQQRLILWSNLYDSIYESEPPPKDVLEDDDMLDGWLSLKRKNKLGDKTTGITNNKIANADEIFLPARTVEEAKEIDSYNDRAAQAIKRRTNAILDKQGEIPDIMLPHMQTRLMMEATQKLSKK